MIYFQSILSLYESTSEEKQDIVLKQLVNFTNSNRQHESFFQFLMENMEKTETMDPNRAKSILNISIKYLNSLDPQFSLSNIKQYVQFLLKLFSLKTQPNLYPEFNDFLKKSFRLVEQYNQDALFTSISKIPLEQSIIPLSILYIYNKTFFDKLLSIFLKSFPNFQKDQNLSIWSIAMSNFLSNTENKNKNDENNSVDKSIITLLDKALSDKHMLLEPKFKLLEASLNYMPTILCNDLLSSHYINLISLVSTSSSIHELTTTADFAKTVLIHLKSHKIANLTTEQIIDSLIKYVLPLYHPKANFNASLTAFFDEVNSETLQSKINDQISSENISMATLFLISRYPTHDTIPHLLTQQRIDQRIQYGFIFHFLSHNHVPYRFLPRLFSILELNDLHFLNEIFQKKSVLYCAASIKFLSQCKSVEKIEFIASLFGSADSIPIIASPYAQRAFIFVACLRSQSRNGGCPIRLLLDYLNECMNAPKFEGKNNEKIDESNSLVDKLDLTTDDVTFVTNASKENSEVLMYDVKKKWEKLNDPKFCQSREIQSMMSENPQRKDQMINEALQLMKEDDVVFSIIIGSLTKDPTLIHNCISTLESSDLFLLTFFFTTAASCNENFILKEIREYVTKEPDQAAQQSFVSRLFSSKSNTISRRQRIARKCIVGIAPFVSFSNEIYETLLVSFPSDSEPAQTQPNSSNEKVSSNRSSFVCESVIEVCKSTTKKEDLHLILQKMISFADSIDDDKLLTQTFITILNANKNLSDKDCLSILRFWINKHLLTNFDDKNQQEGEEGFEFALLSSNKNACKIYLKEMENAINVHGDVPSLFSSFKRALPFLTDFNLSKQPQFLTLIVVNTLSENESVLEFCVNLLRSTFEMNSILNPLKGVVFSNEYTESVRPFFTELSSKFQSKQLIQLTEALLSFYKEKQPKYQESIFLFIIFAILKQPLLFVKNKFVSKITSACEKMTRMNDYAVMFYLSQAFDALNKADRNEFFNEFILVNSCEFSSMYFGKYSVYYESLQPLLIPRILQLRTVDKKWKEYLEFERLLKLLNGFVRFYIKDSSGPDQMSRIIFSFLISISTINIVRNRSLSVDLLLSILENTLIEFKNLTGISLIKPNSRFCLKNEIDFYEIVSFFAQSFQFLQSNVLQTLFSLIETLISTKHCECGIICLSSYLVSISGSNSSSELKRQKNHVIELFTTFLKNCKFETSLIEFVVTRFPSCFTVQTLKEMDQNYLSLFLKLIFDSISKCSDVLPSLHFILNVIRSSTPAFIQPFVPSVMTALKDSVSSGKANLRSILVLNIIGEIGRRKQDPTLLLKDGPVSFRSLAPLLLSDENDLRTRVNAIFSLMIFGKSEMEPDFELVFSSLMSLFVGYENDSSNYVAIANDLLKNFEKISKVEKRNLELLKFAFQPVLLVGDSNCTVAICELLKYLKKLTVDVKDSESDDGNDMFTLVLEMMTLFAKPKRNFPISSS